MSTNGPVMDGATDDMSGAGTPKSEAADLQQAGRDDEIVPPDGLAEAGLEDDPLSNSRDGEKNDRSGT